MQLNTGNFDLLNQSKSKHPVWVVEISFDDTFTDRVYLTSDADAVTPGGYDVIHSVVKSISGTSQKVDPIKAISTIGNLSFDLVDVGEDITTLFRDKLDLDKSLRRKRIRVYLGFKAMEEFDPVLVWDDYVMVTTQTVNSDAFTRGLYHIQCVDIQREQRKDLFIPKITHLQQDISDTDTSIPVLDTTEFDLVIRSLADSDAPGATTGHIKIDNEIIRYTSKTSTTFEGCTRGVLGSSPAVHEIDSSKPVDKRKKITEYIHLEDNAISLAYQILTGKRYGTSDELPAHWHMGIDAAYIRAADFVNIGDDWWDQSDVTAGVRLRFDGLKKTGGKTFLDKQIYQAMGAYSPIYADGSLGLIRTVVVLENASAVALIDKSVIVSVGTMTRNEEMVHNNYEIEWNYDDIGKQYSRKHNLTDDTSIGIYGKADPVSLKLRGIYGNQHTKATLLSRFDSLRSRYASPPLTIPVTCLPSMNMLEVGDVVRLKYDNVRDYAGTVSPIDRSFEVQSMKINWMTGLVTLGLFGSTSQASPISEIAADVSVADAFYSSVGTEIKGYLDTNYPGSYTLIGDHLTITSDVDLPGATSMHSSSAIYYYIGDLTIQTGVTMSSNSGGNCQLRVMGFFQNDGTLSSIAVGHAALPVVVATSATAPRQVATTGLVGYSYGGPTIKRTLLTANAGRDIRFDKIISGMVVYQGDWALGETVASVFPELTLKATATKIEGIPDDFRGGGGTQGGHLDRGYRYGDARLGIRSGGLGGPGGGGFAIICRGFACGSNGKIVTNGGPGTAGESIGTGSGHSRTLHAGRGGGGTAGAVGIFLDGSLSTIGTINLEAEYGDMSVPSGLNAMTSSYLETSSLTDPVYGYHRDIPGLSLEALKVQYIPDAEEAVIDTPTFADYAPSFTATLVTDSPKTANAVFSSIEIDVVPPSDTNYSHSMVYYKKVANPDWEIGGVADDSFVISSLTANGATYDVQIRSVSVSGVESPAGLRTTVLLNSIIEDPLEVIYAPPVTGLELFDKGEGQGNDTDFVGREIKIRWNRSSLDQSYELGSEEGNLGADAGSDSYYFQDFAIEVYNVNTDELVRTEYVKDNQFLYTYEKNALDNGGTAQRSIRFELYQRTRQNQRSARAAKLTVTNPAPGAPTDISLNGGDRFLDLSFTAPTDLDYQSCNIYLGTTSGFTPNAASLVTTLRAADDLIIAKDGSGAQLLSNTEYFVKLETVDAFAETGTVTASLSATTSVTVTVPAEYRYEGLDFQANDPSTNQVSWTAGTAINKDTGGSWTINSGSATWTSGILYLYNVPTSSSILTTTSVATAITGTILASYRGGTALQSGDDGGAYIDGGQVLAQTVAATQMAANSITAANGAIANLAVVEAKINTAAVTTAKIDNLAVTEGKIDSLAVTNAKIGSAAITEAKIDSLAVSTIKIQDQAVTFPGSAYTSGSQTLSIPTGGAGSNVTTTVQTITFTASGSAPVHVNASIKIGGTCIGGSGDGDDVTMYFDVEIYRDTTLLHGYADLYELYGTDTFDGPHAPTAGSKDYAVTIADSPTSGSHDYTIKVKITREWAWGTLTAYAEHASILLLEAKK